MMMPACRRLSAVTAACILLFMVAGAHGRLAIDPLSGIGGYTFQSETDTVAGRPILLQIEGNSLAIYALDNPIVPIQIGRQVFGQTVFRFVLHRQVAYVVSSDLAAEDNWLTMVDYSDPSAPEAIASQYFKSMRRALALNGNYLYLSTAPEGIRVFDITDPAAMKEVTGWTNLVFPNDFAVQGNRLYAAGHNAGFFIFDVANPIQPRKIGEYFNVMRSSQGLIVVTDTLALLDFNNGIELVSVKDPARPTFVKDVYLGQPPSKFLVNGGLAYAVCQYNFISVVDIGRPDSAKVIGIQRDGGEATHITLGGDYLYAASYAAGMQIVSIADPASPALIRTIPTPYYPLDFRLSGNTLYLAANRQGMQVFALDNPALPRRLGSLDTGLMAEHIEIFRNEIAVAGAYGAKLKVIDIRDKAAPKVTDSIALGPETNVQALGKVGEHLYVCTSRGLEVYRAAAGQPVTKVYADTFYANTHALQVKGNLALIARGHLGLQIADVSVPERPTYLGRIDKLGSAVEGVVRFAWHGNMVYTHDDVRGMAMVDVSDPSKPVKVGSLAEPEFPRDIPIWKSHLLVGSAQDGIPGLLAFDISDPARPVREQFIAQRNLAGDFQSMQIVGDRLYLSNSSNGFRIFNLSEEPVTTVRDGRARAGNPGQAESAGRFMRNAGGMRRVFDALGRFLAR